MSWGEGGREGEEAELAGPARHHPASDTVQAAWQEQTHHHSIPTILTPSHPTLLAYLSSNPIPYPSLSLSLSLLGLVITYCRIVFDLNELDEDSLYNSVEV